MTRVITDMEIWGEVRRRVLTGELSKRAACREYEIHWQTLEKILSHSEPPGYQRTKTRSSKLDSYVPLIEETIEQVHRIIDACTTQRMAVYFRTVYSPGLRMEEALNLQVGDIDSKRMMVHVHRGKGAKDRNIPLPESTLIQLREFWKTHKHPKYLIPDRRTRCFSQRPSAAISSAGLPEQTP